MLMEKVSFEIQIVCPYKISILNHVQTQTLIGLQI